MSNIYDPEMDSELDREGFRHRGATLGDQAGSERLGVSLYEVEPGQASAPYHWHVANEETLLTLSGRIELRGPDGVRELGPGEVVAFPRGDRGAHQLINNSDEPARFLVFSEMNYPEIVLYPDSSKVGIRDRHPAGDGEAIRLRFVTGDAVDYWHGEERS
ncbi:MAG: cupin domain-containing protein [Solirubrobacterales bacterium]